MHRKGLRSVRRALAVGGVLLALAAQGGGALAADDAYEPVTVTDCGGVTSTFDAPPERVIVTESGALELMYHLGLEDKVIAVATGLHKGEMPPEFEEEALKLRSLQPAYQAGGSFTPVQKEVMLAEEPDFVLSLFSSGFDGERGAATQTDLAERGIASYLAFTTDCASSAPEPLVDFSFTYTDIENLGKIFGVPDQAAELIAGMKAKVAGVAKALEGVDEKPSVYVFEFSEGTDMPFAPGNRQSANAVVELAGGRNIFDDLDKAYERTTWEEIIARDPDVIVIAVYGFGGPEVYKSEIEQAEEFLRTFPPIHGLEVVRQERFAEVPYFIGSIGGVRNADAVEMLARQLHPDAFS